MHPGAGRLRPRLVLAAALLSACTARGPAPVACPTVPKLRLENPVPGQPARSGPVILVPGHWDWMDANYAWVPSAWRPRGRGTVWVDGSWTRSGLACVWHPGKLSN